MMSSGPTWTTYDPVTKQKRVSKVKRTNKQTNRCFLSPNPIRGYHNDKHWGYFLYKKITQKFITRGFINISDQRGFNGSR